MTADTGAPRQRDRAALVARIVHAVAQALSAPNADLACERAGIVAVLAAHAAAAFGAHARPPGGGAPSGSSW